MVEDITLLKASRNGDAAAFEQIVNRYQALVCAITFSGTGRVDVSEELAQETFLSAWKNLRQLKELGDFRAWLCTIARNMLNNYYRKKKPVPLESEDIIELADHAPNPSETLIAQEESIMLEQALMHMPVEYREPLVMYYRQEQSVREVAVGLGLNESTVRTRLHRARQMLREEMAARLERTLERTAPGKAFTKAVMAAVGAAGIGLTASADAASATAGTASPTGMAAIMSTVTAKVIMAAAVAAVVTGAAIFYVRALRSNQPPIPSREAAVVGDRAETPDISAVMETAESEKQDVTASIGIVENKAVNLQDKTEVGDLPEAETASTAQDVGVVESAGYVFEPNGVLSGLITDTETGEPITDTGIWITCGRIYQTKTDEHGFYSFGTIEKNDNYEISIHSWDHIGIDFNADRPPVISLQKDKQVVRHFQLEKACRVELTVKDEDGNPVKGAIAHVSRVSDSRGWAVGPQRIGENDNETDKNGVVLLGGLSGGELYYLTVQHSFNVKVEGRENFSTHRFDYAPAGLELYPEDPGIIETVEMVLQKGQNVRGFACYQDGEPADDISIVPEPEWWCANRWIPSFEVEPNGFFTLEHVVPGIYSIQARIPEGDGWTGKRILTTSLPPTESDILYVDIPLKSPKSLVSISGTIEWTGDERPNYINIDAYSAAYGHFSTRIWNFKQNTFLIDRMEPGTYQLKVEGETIEPVTIANVKAPMENLVLTLACVKRPRLYGMVMDAMSKKPLAHYQVRVRKLQTLRGPSYSQSDEWISFEGGEGVFDIEAVGPGVYDLQVRAEGYASLWSPSINTDQNSAVLINLAPGGGSMRGQVLDEEGQPVENATVIPLSKACGTSYPMQHTFVTQEGAVTTNDTGEFLLTGLAEGQETLKVMHPDYTYVIKGDIEVKNGQCAEGVTVVLPKGGIIEGVVYTQDGQPQGGVVIRAQNEMGYSITSDDPSIFATTISEPNGFYRITGLPEEICYLMRQDEWTAFGVVRRTVAPMYGKTTYVDFGGTNLVTGQIVLEGKPLADQKVILSDPRSYYSGYLKAVVMTDAEGRFVFRGIAAGHYGLFYEMNRQRSDWLRLAECELRSGDCDLGIIPKESAVLYLSIQQPEDMPWEISSVYFQSETQGSSIAIAHEGAMNPDAPYKVGSVSPGVYSVSITRSDGLSYNRKIEIPQESREVVERIVLPKGDAEIFGTIAEGFDIISIRSVDESIGGIVRREGDGTFKVSSLPAGDYRLGLYPPVEENSVGISLIDGQSLQVTIDRSLFKIPESGAMVLVSVVSETGSLCDASVHLSVGETVIEPISQIGRQKVFVAMPGEYLLRVSCTGYKDVEKPILLKPVGPGESPGLKQNQIMVRLERSTAKSD